MESMAAPVNPLFMVNPVFKTMFHNTSESSVMNSKSLGGNSVTLMPNIYGLNYCNKNLNFIAA